MSRKHQSVLRIAAVIGALTFSTAAAADGVAGAELSLATAAKPMRAGQGTWYGAGFDGRTTASGERFDMYQLTAASAELPLGSYAEVTNLATGQSVVVKINDRQPSSKSLITLSFAAANRIGFAGADASAVTVRAVSGAAEPVQPADLAPSHVQPHGLFSGLQVAALTGSTCDVDGERAGQCDTRAILKARSRRHALRVTWAEPGAAVIPGL